MRALKQIALTIVSVGLYSYTLLAGQLDDQIRARTEQSEAADEIVPQDAVSERRFLAVPVPIVDPTIGNGGGVAGLLTLPGSETNRKVPRSTIGAFAGYTDTDSWMVGAGFKLYLAEDQYRTTLNAGYGSLNLKYYGFGSDSIFFQDPVDYNIKGPFADGSVQLQVVEGTYAGLKGRYLRPAVSVKSPIDALPDLSDSFELAALGLTGTFDSRDNVWSPSSGNLATIDFLGYLSGFGFGDTFSKLDANFAKYWKLTDHLVLAGSFQTSYASDDTPFFMLPFVSVRGIPGGQYLDSTVVQGQVELRWSVWRRFGVVGFAGGGVASDGIENLFDGSNAYGYGGGVRYQISEVDKLNIGIDLAKGSRDNLSIYFRIGEAF